MISLLTALLLLAGSCERKEGTAQCVETEEAAPGRWRCKGSCYLHKGDDGKDKSDGGYYSHLLKTDHQPTEAACLKELDRQAANGCKP